MTTQLFRSLATFSLGLVGWICIASQTQAQHPASAPAGSNSRQPMVIHVHHHHYYNPGARSTEMASFYSPTYAWKFGYQPGTGRTVEPWKQNWGHLGFTGYLGQHGGGVDLTLQSLNVFTGLVVDTVTPDSPASKMGLVPGDFILKINGTAVNNYKQVAILFEQTLKGAKPKIDLTVWNPNTRRKSSLKAVIEDN